MIPELATDIELETARLAKKVPPAEGEDARLCTVPRASLVKNPRIFAGVAA